MPDTDTTPLAEKIEASMKTYIDSILASMSMTGLQVSIAHQDTAALDTPRIVVTCEALSPHSPDLPGVMGGQVRIEYISQADGVPIATHKASSGTLVAWLCDLSTVRAALNTANALHVYRYEFAGEMQTVEAESGTQITGATFNLIAMSKSL